MLVARARAAGVDAHPHGRHERSSRARDALAIAERHDGVFAALGIHPHEAGRRRRRRAARRCSRTERRSPSARPASTTSATTRRATRSARSSTRSSSSPTELGKPVVIHTRAADDDTLAALAGFDGDRRPPLLLVAARCSSRARARLVRLVRRQRHLPEGARAPRRGARRCPPTGCSPRPTSPYLAPQPRRGRPNEPANVVHTRRRARAGRGRGRRRARGADRRERGARASVSVSRRAPKKELGQHFLVDENILGVIGRLAELDAGRRRARDRPRPRRPHALPRRARRARPRGRARPLARAARCRRRATNVDAALRRRARARPRRARAAAAQARREPAVQRRDAARRREPRRPAERSSSGA